MTRRLSPAAGFRFELSAGRGGGQAATRAVTKADAQRALAKLKVLNAPAERAAVVEAFLASADAAALTDKARATLVDFIGAHAAPHAAAPPPALAGLKNAQIGAQLGALAGKLDASALLTRAKRRLEAITSGAFPNSVAKDGGKAALAQATLWLAGVKDDVAEGRTQLAALVHRYRLDGAVVRVGISKRELADAALELDVALQKLRGRLSGMKKKDIAAIKRALEGTGAGATEGGAARS